MKPPAIVVAAIAFIVLDALHAPAPAAVPTGNSAVRTNPRLASLQIDIWPEFDRRLAALVILRGELAAEVALPATVTLRIPAASGGPAAVAYSVTAEGELFNLGHEPTSAADFITLRLQSPQRFFHVEFYDPLTTSAPERSYTYVWPGDLMVDRLRVSLQQPAGASSFSVQPKLGSGSASPDGLIYREVDLGVAAAGKPLAFEIRYTKTDERTSADLLGLKASGSTPAAATGSGKALPEWLLALLVYTSVLGAAGLAGAIWWRMRRKAPGAQPVGGTFCAQCGNRLGAGRLCTACGAPVRGS